MTTLTGGRPVSVAPFGPPCLWLHLPFRGRSMTMWNFWLKKSINTLSHRIQPRMYDTAESGAEAGSGSKSRSRSRSRSHKGKKWRAARWRCSHIPFYPNGYRPVCSVPFLAKEVLEQRNWSSWTVQNLLFVLCNSPWEGCSKGHM